MAVSHFSIIKMNHIILLICALPILPTTTKALKIEDFKNISGYEWFTKQQPLLNLSEPCIRDLIILFKSLDGSQFYGQEIMDAQGRPEPGFLLGSRIMPGRYEECLDAEEPNRAFSGQYCLIKLNIPSLAANYREFPSQKLDATLYLGICTPSTCTPEYLNNTINSLQLPITGVNISNYMQANIDDGRCIYEGKDDVYDQYTWITLCILAFFIFLNCIGIYFADFQDSSCEWLQAWSWRQNFNKLQKEDTSTISCINSLFVLGTILTMIGTYMRSLPTGPVANIIDLYDNVYTPSYMFLNNLEFGEDALLLVTGLAIATKFFRLAQKSSGYDHVIQALKLYAQWTVPVALAIGFSGTIFRHCGSGPMWFRVVEEFEKPCRSNWYYSLLYMQNYFQNGTCMTELWFFDVAMQLFWLSPLILVPALWIPMTAVGLSATLVVVVAAVEFIIAYDADLGPTYFFTRESDHFNIDYIKTHTRAVPWLVGLALGIIIHKVGSKKLFIMRKSTLTVGWLISSFLLIGSYCSILFFDEHYQQPAAALVLAGNRLAWSIGLSWVIFSCATGHSCTLNVVLSYRMFHMMRRLTFAGLLIHKIVTYYHFGLMRDLEHHYAAKVMHNMNIIYVFTMTAAAILAMAVQYPIRNNINLILRNFTLCSLKIKPKPEQNGQSHLPNNITTL